MARDRKRAKQRRDRRSAAAERHGSAAPAPSQPIRADVPGALDHASSEVDEFDAALIAGAGGVPAPAEADQAGAEDQLQAPEPPSGGVGGGGPSGGGAGGGDRERPSGAPLRGGNRAVGFIRASWAELQRVQWPDRRQVTQATAVVLGFVAIAGAYLGVADYVAKAIVELIL